VYGFRWSAWVICAVILTGIAASPLILHAEESLGIKPLHDLPLSQVQHMLPPRTDLLVEANAIERFLRDLDGTPPDWVALHGHGHDDPAHDERLFNLNRERDAKREGHGALSRVVAFVWSGVLSTYDADRGGFHVVLGPRFTKTSWGLVRFKYEDFFGSLIAIPLSRLSNRLQKEIKQGRAPDIDVVMVGTLVPEESIVYDFSHDEDGRGVVMPVVRVQDILYLYHRPSKLVQP